MEKLISFQDNLLRNIKSDFRRYLYDSISFGERMIAIKGIRGVGKTTMVLQYLKTQNLNKSLYVTADHPWFYTKNLLDTAEEWHKMGGRLLIIDEVHKYKAWSSELKNIYDGFPDMQIIFTASSALDIYRGEADLSRRVLSYSLHGLSFREYLIINKIASFKTYSLTELLMNHRAIASEIIEQIESPLRHFKAYLRHGYLPFGLVKGNEQDYLTRVFQIIDACLAYDLAFINDYSAEHQSKIKRLLGILSETVPYIPNILELATQLQIGRNTLLMLLQHLEQASLINLINKTGKGFSALQKPDKITLENTNFCYALSNVPDEGSMREIFFVNQLRNAGYTVEVADTADYLIDGKITVEIGGKSKKKKQIKAINDAFIIKDNIETSVGNVVPLWLFGFLY
jgi:predicted AAA+ superfamily ATPase